MRIECATRPITGNPKFIPIVGVLGSIIMPTGPGPTPPTFPGSGPTVTWEQLAIPGYVSNVARFVVPFGPDSASGGAGGTPQTKNPCTLPQQQRAFLAAHYGEATTLAALGGTSTANILGLAAKETGYGTNELSETYGNYFSLTKGFASGGPLVALYGRVFTTYPSDGFFNSGDSLLSSRYYGPRIAGTSKPEDFAAALEQGRLIYEKPAKAYSQDLVKTINSVAKCLPANSIK